MSVRVVVTGLGVVASNANSVQEFELALRKGRSGIHRIEGLDELGFGCQVAGVPEGADAIAESTFAEHELLAMNSCQRLGSLAALDAWTDAGLPRPGIDSEVDWGTGAILGTGIGGIETIAEFIPLVDAGRVSRVGSTVVEQAMASGVSARVAGLLGLGGQVTTNSSACTTGAEAVVEGARRIRAGHAERMICGGAEGVSRYTWAAFDAMRVLARKFNDRPEHASRPLSASACGFVPAAGAGALMLERLESALDRGVHIYAELLGGAVNSGGQRGGGSMTAPNAEGVRRCIRGALRDARVTGAEVDAINGHLTGTGADAAEVRAWATALGRPARDFPALTATKSLIGHSLGAAGAIESVASVLMLEQGFLHPCVNCEDLHPEIQPFAAAISARTREAPELRTLVKAGFGFGDVNACLVLRRWDS